MNKISATHLRFSDRLTVKSVKWRKPSSLYCAFLHVAPHSQSAAVQLHFVLTRVTAALLTFPYSALSSDAAMYFMRHYN